MIRHSGLMSCVGLSRRALKAYARSRQETRNFLSDERMALLSKAFPDTYLAVLLDANSHVVCVLCVSSLFIVTLNFSFPTPLFSQVV